MAGELERARRILDLADNLRNLRRSEPRFREADQISLFASFSTKTGPDFFDGQRLMLLSTLDDGALERVRGIALEEIEHRIEEIVRELTALGVDPDAIDP